MRHRWTTCSVVTALTAAAATLFVAGPASADLVTSCTGAASDVTVPNDLFVPAGRSCELTNVVINGNTTVRAGANLVLDGATLNGNLAVQSDGFASLVGTTVTGTTRLNTAFGGYAESSTLANVTATGAGFLYAFDSSLTNVTSTNGETFLESARLSRNLSSTGDLFTDVFDSVVQGAVTVAGAELGSVLCLSEIDGDTSFSGSGGGTGAVLQIGGSAPFEGCGVNVFGGNVSLTGNAAPSYLSDHVIRGDLVCTDNNPAPVVSGGRVRGQATGQCASPGGDSAVASTVGNRGADILARAKSRISAGKAAAAKAGSTALGT
jgi:hypothetical protein